MATVALKTSSVDHRNQRVHGHKATALRKMGISIYHHRQRFHILGLANYGSSFKVLQRGRPRLGHAFWVSTYNFCAVIESENSLPTSQELETIQLIIRPKAS
jgi:hypothetical protein